MKKYFMLLSGLLFLSACTKEVIDPPANDIKFIEDSMRSNRKPPKPKEPTTVMDIDSNVYNIHAFGSQTWMLEDLKTTRYNNGALINDTVKSKYTYYTISTDKICPVSWHVPYDWEWNILIDYFETSKNKEQIGNCGEWWCATGYDSWEAWIWYKFNCNDLIYKRLVAKDSHYFVRCIKNN